MIFGIEDLTGDLLLLRQHTVGPAEVDADVPAEAATHDTGDGAVLHLAEVVDDRVLLLFPDLLGDDVLGVGGGDTAEITAVDIHAHLGADLAVEVELHGLVLSDLQHGVLDLLGASHHSLDRVDMKFRSLSVDLDADVVFLAEMALAGCAQ